MEEEQRGLAVLWEACSGAGFVLGPALAADGHQQHHAGKLPSVDPDGNIDFPTLFLYPQYQQSDFIEAFRSAAALGPKTHRL